MNPTHILACALFVAVAATGQAQSAGGKKSNSKKNGKSNIGTASLERVSRAELPDGLREVSGLIAIRDGSVLAHNDSKGTIWEIDYRRGTVVKSFNVGSPPITGDFEGIALAGNRLFIMTSNGVLYEFTEGANNSTVQPKQHDPGLAGACEFEGLAYEAASRSLLLACKNILGSPRPEAIRVYKWKVDGSARATQLEIPVAIFGGNWKQLRPSEIAIDPRTGNYVLISSQDDAIVSVTPSGGALSAQSLPPGHKQPEGLAITGDGLVIISDEGGRGGTGGLTVYRWK